MRVLLVGGLNDLLKGGNYNSVKEDIEKFARHLKDQDSHHPGLTNEFSVATLLNPPKMVWCPDDGPPPLSLHILSYKKSSMFQSNHVDSVDLK